MEEIGVVVIGAGVVGLAVANELSKTCSDMFIVERHDSFGQETSSRNSEVIHAGIYYPPGTLKAKTCVDGKDLLYKFCQSHNVEHKKIGKLIVAIEENELSELQKLLQNGHANGVEDLVFLGKDEIAKREPYIKALAAICSPSTGILDTHSYMAALAKEFTSRGGGIVYNTQLIAIEKNHGGFKIIIEDTRNERACYNARVVVNCAGLESDKVARMADINDDSYRLKFSKGDYFRVHNGKARFLKGLVYPVPGRHAAGLGVHATLDIAGGLKLGPDDAYVDTIDYVVDARKRSVFHKSVKNFLPFIEEQDLEPDTCGIRPKLQGRCEGFRDFLIKEESDRGLPRLINLIGIESPGLTASLAIAKLVKNICVKL